MRDVGSLIDDDSFHAPLGDDITWTETSWFAFDLPERSLSMAVYPLFRPVMGICSLAIHVWDDSGIAPWEIPYSRFLWHIPMPTRDLTHVDIAGLSMETLEPAHRYLLSYADGDRIRFELEFEGIREPHHSSTQVPTTLSAGTGHFDQAMVVNGEMVLNGDRIAINCYGQRDRSWYHRSDSAKRPSGTASFGTLDRANHFMAVTPKVVLGQVTDDRRPSGYLVTHDELNELVGVRRTVIDRVAGRPQAVELELTDATGRVLTLSGRPKSCLAFNTSPPVLSFFSQMDWSTDGRSYIGEDQDVLGMEEAARAIRETRR